MKVESSGKSMLGSGLGFVFQRRRVFGARSVRKAVQTHAMVNVDVSPSVILGVGLIGTGVSLWQIRQSKPWISKDYDVVVSCISLLVGGILIFQGWRLDPLLLFGQLMTTGAAVSFGIEALRLRSEVYEREEKEALQDVFRRKDGPGGKGGGGAFQLPPPPPPPGFQQEDGSTRQWDEGRTWSAPSPYAEQQEYDGYGEQEQPVGAYEVAGQPYGYNDQAGPSGPYGDDGQYIPAEYYDSSAGYDEQFENNRNYGAEDSSANGYRGGPVEFEFPDNDRYRGKDSRVQYGTSEDWEFNSTSRAPSSPLFAMPTSSIMWFRKGLRLHDNPALLEAVKDVEHMYPIFILDPNFQDPKKVGVNRMQFLLESLFDLDASLRARGSRLYVLQGSPEATLPRLFSHWSVSKLCFERDAEPYALARDSIVLSAATAAGVSVHSPVSHTMYDPQVLIQRAGGQPPLTMKSFEKLVDSIGNPPAPAPDPPSTLPAPTLGVEYCGDLESRVPALSDLAAYAGHTPTTPFHGGESVALARMADYLADKDWVASFEKPKGNPSTFSPRPATTVLSPYLKFGCLSPRLFHAKLLTIYREKKGHSRPPVSLRGQLLWREFFYCASVGVPNFDRMHGNAICKQIPWDDNLDFLKAWEESRTGYPWIDAIMAQLRTEGWMHHLARHSVACFLTRGDLYCSWESGRDVFDRYLLDADWALNNANWMWLSASAFFSQYFRVYSPISFGKQYDKNGDYIRRYLPVLKDMPAKYIYEPWSAPSAVQEAAGCIIGRDYPAPIVDHAEVVKLNVQKMKKAYAQGKVEGSEGPKKKSRKE